MLFWSKPTRFTRTTYGISLRLLKSKESLKGTFHLKSLKVRQHRKFKITRLPTGEKLLVKNGDQYAAHFETLTLKTFMNCVEPSISLCRHCRHYIPEGRRGGSCQKLNVSVKSQWTACSLSAPPFLPPWNRLGDILIWQQKALEVQGSVEANAFRDDIDSQEVTSQAVPTLSIEASSSRI